MNTPGDTSGGPSRRTVLQTLGAAGVATSLAGCGGLFGGNGGSELGDTLRIGALAPDADTNPVGASIRGGAEVAVRELDEEGVLDAENVELYVGNTEGTASGAGDAYNDLVLEEDVHFTMGCFASEAFIGIMDDIVSEQRLHLAAGASTLEMNERLLDDYEANKYMFRVGPFNGELLGQSLVDFAAEFYEDPLGWDRTAVLYEEAEWTGPVVSVLENQLDDHGFEVVDTQSYSMSSPDFSSIYDNLPDDIDGVTTLMAHTGFEAARQWNGQQRSFEFGGIHVPAQNPAYQEDARLALSNVWTVNTATPGTNITSETEEFTQSFLDQTEGFAPVYTAYIAYDAIKLYAQYAEHVGSINEDDIIDAMASNELTPETTTTDAFEFYEADHDEYPHDIQYDREGWLAGNNAPIFNQWQDGQLVTFKPDAHQQAPYQHPARLE